jgi:hypothetical protein
MSSVAITGNAAGAGVFTIASPNSASSFTATLPAVTGTLLSSAGALVTSATGSIGYGTGAGNAVTQATSKSTSVTLNAPTGQITMNGAALASNTTVSFTFGNSLLAITDIFVFSKTFNVGTNGAYQIFADVNPGAAQINVRNISGGSLSEAIVINFAIIKGASA